jgi:peptidyl-prolyl cis-trans isomerase A (cyclophilin A)
MIKNTFVAINTELGSITVELFTHKAPETVANFLHYIDSGRFSPCTVFRIVNKTNAAQAEDANSRIQVIQAGLPPEHPLLLPPIIHESTEQTNIKHLHGTISMARFEPGTADGSFFFCIGEQAELNYGGARYADGLGFAAFGQANDIDNILDKIYARAEKNEYLDHEVLITSITRL